MKPMYERCGFNTRDELGDVLLFRQDPRFFGVIVLALAFVAAAAWSIHDPSPWPVVIAVGSLIWGIALVLSLHTVMVCKDRLALVALTERQTQTINWNGVDFVELSGDRLKVGVSPAPRVVVFGRCLDVKQLHTQLEEASRRGEIPSAVVVR